MPRSQFAFLHVGNDISLPTLLVRSIRATNKNAVIYQCSDTGSPAAAGIDQRVTDLASLGATCSRNTVLAYLLEELLPVLRTFERDGLAPLASEWNARHAFGGKRVMLTSEQGAGQEGMALGANADGALLLDTGKGILQVVSGEVSLRAG